MSQILETVPTLRGDNVSQVTGHYKEKLDKTQCWREFKTCPLGKEFLEKLYSWSEVNHLDPMLAWKICEPCYSREIEFIRKPDGKLSFKRKY